MIAANRSVRASILLVTLALWLGGCAHEPTAGPKGLAPAIQLASELELLDFRTSHDQVATLLDNQGYAHVFIAAASTREVFHILVSPDGQIQRELVAAERSPSSISAAYGNNGRLHLLMDDIHVVREAGGWTEVSYTPWKAAGIKARTPRLLQGQGGILWSFLVDGKAIGAGGRWDWYFIGGAFAAMIFPWHHASEKLVIVPEAGMAKPFWYVIDPQDNRDALHVMSGVDGHGKLYIVYGSSRTAFMTDEQPRYAEIQLEPSQPPEALLPGKTSSSMMLFPIPGKQITLLQPDLRDLDQAAVAVDPQSGLLLMVRAHLAAFALTRDGWSLPLRLPLAHFWEPRLAPAGGDAFHLMTVMEDKVLYLLYTQDGWSAPVEIGRTQVAASFGSIWQALAMASGGRNRAFLVWPTATGIVGRWIEGDREIEARARSDDLSLGEGGTIPGSLLDFANGKAALATPAWTSGFAEATSAGMHSKLAKQLHDSARWQALASLVQSDSYGDDLRWYFLGRAAEGMALCDAAELYYKLSRERSKSLATRCWGLACEGFKFPQVLDERFRAIQVLREAGNCLTPPRPASHGGY